MRIGSCRQGSFPPRAVRLAHMVCAFCNSSSTEALLLSKSIGQQQQATQAGHALPPLWRSWDSKLCAFLCFRWHPLLQNGWEQCHGGVSACCSWCTRSAGVHSTPATCPRVAQGARQRLSQTPAAVIGCNACWSMRSHIHPPPSMGWRIRARSRARRMCSQARAPSSEHGVGPCRLASTKLVHSALRELCVTCASDQAPR